MRALGYPKRHELLTAWIDELASGRRKLRHGPVPEELKRKAVVAVASGRLKSREAAAELGVEASVVGKPETADARRIQGDARDEDTWREAPDGRGGENRRGALYAGGPRDAAGLADAVAALEKRLAETRARLDELDADVERQRREKRELDIEELKEKGEGALELLGKEPGAVPENPASREKTILVKQTSEKLGVTARSLLPMVGIARSTYHYQLKSMKRPDKDSGLLELVREALREQQAQVRVQADPPGAEGHGNRGQREADHEAHDQERPGAPVQEREAVQLVHSYKGEPDKAPKNLVDRDFHAERPNMPWVTDLTEFSIPAGKAYLSPVIDCHDGMPVACTIGTSLDSALADGMLPDACSTLKDGKKPIIHSD